MNSLKLQHKRGSAFFFSILILMMTMASVLAGDKSNPAQQNFAVTHGPITMTLADHNSNGHQLADLRAGSLPTFDIHGQETGRLDAMLVTTGIDIPNPNDETRISTLIFSFGDGVDQIVINGSGFYPAAGGTIDLDSTVIRPITGGSGVYAGASGWAETEHFEDDTWRHSFHLLNPGKKGDHHQ
jgi:hypothetical protein